MKYANLHLHSTYSDAQFTPEQLFLIGKSLGYKAMAITDHETDGGVRPLMKYARAEGGVDIISGVEFSGKYDRVSFHITALDYDIDNPDFRAFVKERCDLRAETTRLCVERGIKLGVIQGITWNDVLDCAPEGSWICIDTVMNTFRTKHLPIPENLRADCFKGPEVRAFAPIPPSAEEIIKVIRKAGGIASLAHPYRQTQYVPALVELGLNGIEVSHPDNYENTCALAMEAAKTYNLYHSGGTDHTGPMSGCGNSNAIPAFNGITEEEYTILKERRLG